MSWQREGDRDDKGDPNARGSSSRTVVWFSALPASSAKPWQQHLLMYHREANPDKN